MYSDVKYPSPSEVLCTKLIKQAEICHELDVFDARRGIAEHAAALGFRPEQVHYLVTVVTELGNNIVFHADHGVIVVQQVSRRQVGPLFAGEAVGIRIIAQDQGPGIADIALARQEGFSTRNSLGCGLSGVERLMDEVTIHSNGQGTEVSATLWLEDEHDD